MAQGASTPGGSSGLSPILVSEQGDHIAPPPTLICCPRKSKPHLFSKTKFLEAKASGGIERQCFALWGSAAPHPQRGGHVTGCEGWSWGWIHSLSLMNWLRPGHPIPASPL